MECVMIVGSLLAICLIALVPVILNRPKRIAELEKENDRLEELIQNREDLIEHLEEQLAEYRTFAIMQPVEDRDDG